MKNSIIIFLVLLGSQTLLAQSKLVDRQSRTFKTTQNIDIKGEVGFLETLENRKDPNSRTIRVKYIHLKSLAAEPLTPILYLEGGGSAVTWQAEDPGSLSDWLSLLQIADLIFIDQRGTTDQSLIHIWQGPFPENFMVSAEAAGTHYRAMARQALPAFKSRNIDVTGYTTEEHAEDVKELTEALGLDRFNLLGFSFGTHIGMTTMRLFPEKIENAVLIGADAPDQSFNYPSHLDEHVQKVADMVAADPELSAQIPDFTQLLNKLMKQVEANPVTVTVKNPLTREDMPVKVGAFGLGLVLRLDIDDANDLPVMPRLLYSIDQGDLSLLQWFVQKRIVFALALPGNGINQALASGILPERQKTIEAEAKTSPFGNIVNFPFYDMRGPWPVKELAPRLQAPLQSNIRTLFVSGDLDARTPVQQVDETRKGMSNAIHLVVKGAGHEQVLWAAEIIDEAIPQFLQGKDVSQTRPVYGKVAFIPITGASGKHPSIK